MSKKLSKETYKIYETEDAHVVMSKDTKGTIRALEYTNAGNKLVGPAELVPVEEHRELVSVEEHREPNRYEDFSPGQQIAIDLASIAIDRTTDFLLDQFKIGVGNWLENRREKKRRQQEIEHEECIATIRRTEAQRRAAAQQIPAAKRAVEAEMAQTAIGAQMKRTVTPSIEFNDAYSGFQINMTSEEARKEFIDAFILYMLSAKKMQRLVHANIISEDTGESIEGADWIESLCSQEILGNVNAVLHANPGLLENWQSIALSNILGRELVLEGQYAPIEAEPLKKALTFGMGQ